MQIKMRDTDVHLMNITVIIRIMQQHHAYRYEPDIVQYNDDVRRDEATTEHVDTDVIEKEDEEPDECLAPPDSIPTTSRRSMSDYAGKDGHI